MISIYAFLLVMGLSSQSVSEKVIEFEVDNRPSRIVIINPPEGSLPPRRSAKIKLLADPEAPGKVLVPKDFNEAVVQLDKALPASLKKIILAKDIDQEDFQFRDLLLSSVIRLLETQWGFNDEKVPLGRLLKSHGFYGYYFNNTPEDDSSYFVGEALYKGVYDLHHRNEPAIDLLLPFYASLYWQEYASRGVWQFHAPPDTCQGATKPELAVFKFKNVSNFYQKTVQGRLLVCKDGSRLGYTVSRGWFRIDRTQLEEDP